MVSFIFEVWHGRSEQCATIASSQRTARSIAYGVRVFREVASRRIRCPQRMMGEYGAYS